MFGFCSSAVNGRHTYISKKNPQILGGGGNGRLCRVREEKGEWAVQQVICCTHLFGLTLENLFGLTLSVKISAKISD